MKTLHLLALAATALGALAFTAQSAHAQGDATHWSIDTDAHPTGIGGGGFNFNNGPIIGSWDNFQDFGSLIFQANFNNMSFDDTSLLASSGVVQPWGPASEENTATYGETFTDPAGAISLNSFTFFINDQGDNANFQYQAFVMTWAGPLIGAGAVDESAQTLVYASNPVTYVGNGTIEAITATIPGGLLLRPGTNYEIGFSTLGTNVLIPVGPGTGPSGPVGAPDATSTALLLLATCGGLAAARRHFGQS